MLYPIELCVPKEARIYKPRMDRASVISPPIGLCLLWFAGGVESFGLRVAGGLVFNPVDEIEARPPPRLLHEHSSGRELGADVRHAPEVHPRGSQPGFGREAVRHRLATRRTGSARTE